MRNDLKKTIIVLDESSLASTKQMHGLLKIADKLDIKVISVGDKKQLGAVEAGKPFAQLQEHGMSTVNMDNILRQKTTELKEAVLHSIEGNVYKALEKLEGNIVETDNVSEKAASLWLSHKDRDNTLVLAPSNKIRQEINSEIRSSLQEEGSIYAQSETLVSKLEQKGMTMAESSYSQSYEKGDVVLFNRSYKTLGVQKGDYLEVSKADNVKHVVSLISDKGKEIQWKLAEVGSSRGSVEVFTKKEMAVAEGDKIVWKRNNRDSGMINSHNATVKEITETKITFTMQNGKEKTFDRNDPAISHMDYAYAVTVYSAQGKTANNVIAVANSEERFLTTQPTFYVEISRAKYEATLVVDDKQRVADILSEATGSRISAMESQGLVFEGDSPFEKVEQELVTLQETLSEDKKLNDIADSSQTDITAPDIEIEKLSPLDEIDKMLENIKSELASEPKELITDTTQETKEPKSIESLFPEMYEKDKESFDDMLSRIEDAGIDIQDKKDEHEKDNESGSSENKKEDFDLSF